MNKLQNVMMKMPDINAVNTETEATTLASSSFFFSNSRETNTPPPTPKVSPTPVNINAKGKTMEESYLNEIPRMYPQYCKLP